MKNDIVKNEIQKELNDTLSSMREAEKQFVYLKNRANKLSASLKCKHKWKDGGSSTLCEDVCTVCGYQRYFKGIKETK